MSTQPSLPVVAPLEDDTLYIPYPNFQAAIAFSPDSHYLAFLAPGKVIVDGDGWPQEVEENAQEETLDIASFSQYCKQQAINETYEKDGLFGTAHRL